MPLHGHDYGEGMFVIVAKLENLPANVRERVPQGYVVKQYKMSEQDWHTFLSDKDERSKSFRETWFDLLNEGGYYGWNSKEETLNIFMSAVQSYVGRYGRRPTVDELHQDLLDQQRAGTLTERDKMFLDREVLQKWWNESSLMGMAKELKRRHDLVAGYFQDTLPHLVVNTQFLVGSPDSSREQARLYEVQKQAVPLRAWQKMLALAEERRQPGYYDDDAQKEKRRRIVQPDPLYQAYSGASVYYQSAGEISERVKQYLAEAGQVLGQAVRDELADKPEKLKRLKSELQEFIAKAKILPQAQDWIPFDLPLLDNLVFTEEGLRIIDTNQGLQPRRMVHEEYKERVTAQYTRALDILQEIQKNL